MSRHRRSRVALSLTLSLLLALASPLVAYAGILDAPTGTLTSSTNASAGDSWWRAGTFTQGSVTYPVPWGNSPKPDLNIPVPDGTDLLSNSTVEGMTIVTGLMYRFGRAPSAFDPMSFGFDQGSVDYIWGYTEETGKIHTVYDVLGRYSSNPGAYTATEPQLRLPYEGVWVLDYSYIGSDGLISSSYPVTFGIDLTPPLAVSKAVVKPYLSYTGQTGIWFPQTYGVVQWEDKEYDLLSGVGAYEIKVNGEPLTDYVYQGPLTNTQQSLEDLKPGKNTITITSIDKATNEGPAVTTYFYSDPDVPVLKIKAPAAGGLVPRNAVFTVDATDGGGIQYVQFYIDGVLVGTDTTAPYALSKDMVAYANGTHQLLVKTKDMYGREVTQSRSFTLDKTPAVISGISDTPDPFYPRLQDGYKDAGYYRFNTNEAGYAYLYVYSGTTLVAAKSRPASAGTVAFSWDGSWNQQPDADASTNATYGYRFLMIDKAGNRTWSGLYSTTVRDYELIRVAPNAVRVIER
ncbi:MAG: hypothetical protein KJ747_03520 [Actinobacteria bacterium]|nr:hypothetical protein [Actinomycetota bacterium]MCG2808147.1 Ig-like domain-containing protein [Coriobacteriia bacterium]